jgi:hypothetical protein
LRVEPSQEQWIFKGDKSPWHVFKGKLNHQPHMAC